MKDRFKFRAAMKTGNLCIIVPIEAVFDTYYTVNTNVAKEIFDKKYPEKCFFSDFLEIVEKQEYISQYSFDCDLLITKDFTNLLQCTGLKDNNGKLIFEGDIVKIPDDFSTYGLFAGDTREIYYAFGGFRLKPKWDTKSRGNWLEDTAELEVIGNLYANPELLKEVH